MKHFFLTLISFTLFTSLAFAENDSTPADVNLKNAIESLSKTMTPEQRKILNQQMDMIKQKQKEYNSLSPEQKKLAQDEALRKMNSPENQKKMKEAIDNMSDSDKELFMNTMRKAQ